VTLHDRSLRPAQNSRSGLWSLWGTEFLCQPIRPGQRSSTPSMGKVIGWVEVRLLVRDRRKTLPCRFSSLKCRFGGRTFDVLACRDEDGTGMTCAGQADKFAGCEIASLQLHLPLCTSWMIASRRATCSCDAVQLPASRRT